MTFTQNLEFIDQKLIVRLEQYITLKEKIKHLCISINDDIEEDGMANDILIKHLYSRKWFYNNLVTGLHEGNASIDDVIDMSIAWGRHDAYSEVLNVIGEFENPMDEDE